MAVVALVAAAYATPAKVSYKPLACKQQLSEYQGVAAIATATGRFPGIVKPLPYGTRLVANPHMCDGK